jgi:plasmid stabilization system protein ParE
MSPSLRVSEPLRIRVSVQALGQIEEAADWWAKNRPAAPGAIRQDVAEILEVLVQQPVVGMASSRGRIRGLRRVTLRYPYQ